ncbi:MAG: putative toxin-antitoxin system toxin component, PIN family [Burkholderiales bacterium]
MKVFLDTNVLVAAFATRGLCADLFELVIGEHELVCGTNVLRELEKALRSKIRLPASQCKDIVQYVGAQVATIVSGAAHVIANVEIDDARVLGEARAAAADVFVTGDVRVLALGSVDEMPIRTPRQFWDMVQSATR